MPIYVYRATSSDNCICAEGFEYFEAITADPLKQCPECGAEIKRVIQAVGISVGKKHLLRDKNLKKHGFTKLVNEGDGKFRKI